MGIGPPSDMISKATKTGQFVMNSLFESSTSTSDGKGSLFKIGRPCTLPESIDPGGRICSLLRSKMSIIDITPCNYNVDLKQIAEDAQNRIGLDALLPTIDYAEAMESYQLSCKGYSVPSDFVGVRIYTTDDTSCSDNLSNSYDQNFFSEAMNQASSLFSNFNSFSSSVTSKQTEKLASSAVGATKDLVGNTVNNMSGMFGANPEQSNVASNVAAALAGQAVEFAMRGSKVQLPQIWNNTSYDVSTNLNFKLVSPYGHPLAIKEFIIKPLIYLYLLASPRTTDGVSYYRPPVVTVNAYGISYMPLASISNISLRRGGMDTSFNLYKQPLSMDVTLTVTPLVSGFAAFTQEKNGPDHIEKDAFLNCEMPLDYTGKSKTSLSKATGVGTLGKLIQSLRPTQSEAIISANSEESAGNMMGAFSAAASLAKDLFSNNTSSSIDSTEQFQTKFESDQSISNIVSDSWDGYDSGLDGLSGITDISGVQDNLAENLYGLENIQSGLSGISSNMMGSQNMMQSVMDSGSMYGLPDIIPNLSNMQGMVVGNMSNMGGIQSNLSNMVSSNTWINPDTLGGTSTWLNPDTGMMGSSFNGIVSSARNNMSGLSGISSGIVGVQSMLGGMLPSNIPNLISSVTGMQSGMGGIIPSLLGNLSGLTNIQSGLSGISGISPSTLMRFAGINTSLGNNISNLYPIQNQLGGMRSDLYATQSSNGWDNPDNVGSSNWINPDTGYSGSYNDQNSYNLNNMYNNSSNMYSNVGSVQSSLTDDLLGLVGIHSDLLDSIGVPPSALLELAGINTSLGNNISGLSGIQSNLGGLSSGISGLNPSNLTNMVADMTGMRSGISNIKSNIYSTMQSPLMNISSGLQDGSVEISDESSIYSVC